MGKRRNSGKPWGQRDTREGGSQSKKTPQSHPEHLKGRDIGMFYRNRQKDRRKRILFKPLGTVKLTTNKRKQIHKMLYATSIEASSAYKDSEYSDLEDSKFKRSFLSTIQGNILDKLEKSECAIKRDSKADDQFYRDLKAKAELSKYCEMQKKRKRLPSFKERENLLKIIEENQVVLISGETGCGKTTQVAQFILDDYIEKKNGSLCSIVCTQPRRISAVAVADRVATERLEQLGSSVGFQIRLEAKLPRQRGSILFCTTAVVLRKMEKDPGLGEISHLIIDEIHERSVPSDFLITLLKEVIKKRKDLKIILMSATLNAEAFSKYFNNCPHINIPGFTFPVKEYFLEDVLALTNYTVKTGWAKPWKKKSDSHRQYKEYIMPYIRKLENEKKYHRFVCEQLRKQESEELDIDLILNLLICIVEKEDDGAILVFLPGYGHISDLIIRMRQCSKFPGCDFLLIPLHSMMPTMDQRQVFQPAPAGKRKIIISTNVAETSITIDDVTYVINCGKMKVTDYNPETNQETLQVQWVSRANADQRKGRAGRVKAGVCYHLYTRARHEILEQYQKPEIVRVRLEGTILTAKILQLGKVETFLKNLMNPPDPDSVKNAVNLLQRLNALDEDENLTPLGYHLGRLPISPQMGKMILMGAIFSCLDPILSIVASLDYKDPFQIPLGKERFADSKKRELANGCLSDHLLFSKAITEFEKAINRYSFCHEYFLSLKTMNLLIGMKEQFMQHLYDLNLVTSLNPRNPEFNYNSKNVSLVKAIVCAGLYPNVAIIELNAKGRIKHLRSIDYTQKYKFHPKSVMYTVPFFESPLVVYYQKLKSTKDFIHDSTIVSPLPIIFFGDHYDQTIQDGVNMISVNRLMKFRADPGTCDTISMLRQRLNWLLDNQIRNPGFLDWAKDSDEISILRAIMELITTEDIGFDASEYFADCASEEDSD